MRDNHDGTYDADFRVLDEGTFVVEVSLYKSGIIAEYFTTTDWSGTAVSQIESSINFDWGIGNIGPL